MKPPDTDYPRSWYAATAPARAAYAALQGEVRADVCVVGGGVTGCSTALHLAQRGYRVVLLEARQIGWGASGRSGGQLLPGFSSEQAPFIRQLGAAAARRAWDLSVAAVQLCEALIDQHDIECDLQRGHLLAAIKPRHVDGLREYQRMLVDDYAYGSARLLGRDETRATIASERYIGALYDSASLHLHPLNYTLGLARAAAQAGATLHEHSAVIELQAGNTARIRTAQGVVNADHVVLCCNTDIDSVAPSLAERIMRVTTYIVATTPLESERAQSLIRNHAAVADCNFILDYFRLSQDARLLFGGRVSYSGHDFFDSGRSTRQRMLQVFPQLKDVDIEFVWGGDLDITYNRAPDFGRLQRNVYYLQGFSGHGMALGTMGGKLVAEAIAGQAERFDLFTQLEHRRFPGGTRLRMPLLVLAMLWYRLRDAL